MRMLISQSAGGRQVCFCVTRAMIAAASSAVKPALTRSSVSTPSKAWRVDAHVNEAAREGGIELVGLEQQRHGVAARIVADRVEFLDVEAPADEPRGQPRVLTLAADGNREVVRRHLED